MVSLFTLSSTVPVELSATAATGSPYWDYWPGSDSPPMADENVGDTVIAPTADENIGYTEAGDDNKLTADSDIVQYQLDAEESKQF